MSNSAKSYALWDQLRDLKDGYKWVDLTHVLSPETPHWYGFQPLGGKKLFDFDAAPMKVFEYTVAGQYGTHADVPGHFDPNGRLMHEIRVDEFAYPLCVVDKSAAVAANNDYALTKEDVLEWEALHGQVPEGAFVAFRSDWSKRSASEYDNKDADGGAHYPGWDLDCVKWLSDVRHVGAIGHETSDTDPANRQAEIGFAAEDYILRQDKLNVEVMCNLDQVPPAGSIIFVVFPRLKDGTGFPTRCFAICPKE
jgi:kynurenine formamidase